MAAVKGWLGAAALVGAAAVLLGLSKDRKARLMIKLEELEVLSRTVRSEEEVRVVTMQAAVECARAMHEMLKAQRSAVYHREVEERQRLRALDENLAGLDKFNGLLERIANAVDPVEIVSEAAAEVSVSAPVEET